MPDKKLIIKWLIIIAAILVLRSMVMGVLYSMFIVPNYTEPAKIMTKLLKRNNQISKPKVKTIEKQNIEIPEIQKGQIIVYLSNSKKWVVVDREADTVEIDILANKFLDGENKEIDLVIIKCESEGKWPSAEQLISICNKRGFRYSLKSMGN